MRRAAQGDHHHEEHDITSLPTRKYSIVSGPVLNILEHTAYTEVRM